MRLNDLTNQRFGNLVVLERDSLIYPHGRVCWVCRCDCSTIISIIGNNLTNGKSRSCGCLRITHGLSDTPEYHAWQHMKQRCYDSGSEAYHNYGGRGIVVCDRWLNSFENFYADMGLRPGDEFSIERRNVDGNYEPNNCYWATMLTQQNNKRNNRVYTVGDEIKTLTEWSRDVNINRTTIDERLKRGMSFEEAITQPVIDSRFKPTQ